MTTETIVDPGTIDQSVFEVPCEIKIGRVLLGVVVGATPCTEVAKWAGDFPCCGVAQLVCESHRKSPFPWFCTKCNTSSPSLLNWRKL